MEINRHDGNHTDLAREWITYCLDRLEQAPGFLHGLEWTTKVVPQLTLEELIGALVAAEHYLDAKENER